MREIADMGVEVSSVLGVETSDSVTGDSLLPTLIWALSLFALGSGIFFPWRITPVSHGIYCDTNS